MDKSEALAEAGSPLEGHDGRQNWTLDQEDRGFASTRARDGPAGRRGEASDVGWETECARGESSCRALASGIGVVVFSSVHLIILLVVLAIYALSIGALVVTVRSDQLMTSEKIIWSAILLLVPGIGLIVWALLWFTRRWPRHSV